MGSSDSLTSNPIDAEGGDTRKDSLRQARDIPCDALAISSQVATNLPGARASKQRTAGEPDTQSETAPPGGSPQGSRTGTALAGARARQIDGGALSSNPLVEQLREVGPEIALNISAHYVLCERAADEIERQGEKLRYVAGQLEMIIGKQEGSPIEAYARRTVAAFERLTAELADTKADYLRRHKDAVDRMEEITALKAERDRLAETLAKYRAWAAEKRCEDQFGPWPCGKCVPCTAKALAGAADETDDATDPG